MPRRLPPRGTNRFLLFWLHRLCPSVPNSIVTVKPDTVVRWHERGFEVSWRWMSRGHAGRPRISKELRTLIRELSLANLLWGTQRTHSEVLKVGIDVVQSMVAKYMGKRRPPRPRSWRTFLKNHADGIASIDCLLVPTVTFERLFALVILRHDRRRVIPSRLGIPAYQLFSLADGPWIWTGSRRGDGASGRPACS
jgi:hypothetical protein